MFAIIESGSQQYRIAEGDNICTNKIDQPDGAEIVIDKVLLFLNGQEVRVGRPYLTDVTVKAKVVRQAKGEKVVAFKFRRRKDSSSKVGHRQRLTVLNITQIAG